MNTQAPQRPMAQDRPQQQAPRPANPPAPAPPPAAKPITYHVTFHLLSPKGFPIDVERDVPASDLMDWLNRQDEALAKAGFKGPQAAVLANFQAPDDHAAASDDESWLPKFCPDCGSARETYYDNRGDANRPQGGPDLKCRQCQKGFWKEPPRSRRPARR
jgi:hypothetical protein